MKALPVEDFIELLKRYDRKVISIYDVTKIAEQYGDDYFLVDNSFELCKMNEKRKQIVNGEKDD